MTSIKKNTPKRANLFKNITLFHTIIIVFICICSFSTRNYYNFNGLGVKAHPYNLEIPKNFPEVKIPKDNPLTIEGVNLGRELFYEPMLSANNKMSCGTCHQQKFAFVDSTRSVSIGIDGLPGKRNTLSVFNLAWIDKDLFWDGRSKDLESQVIEPIQNPKEMHQSLSNTISKLQSNKHYSRLFKKAFGSSTITIKMVQNAIAQFERTIISSNSRYDKFRRNEEGGYLTTEEKDGLNLFINDTKGNCATCHTLNTEFNDKLFHNIGLDSITQDSGRVIVLNANYSLGKFRTPNLRNVELTAPYMHDGRFQTLYQVLDHYDLEFKRSIYLDKKISKRRKGNLSKEEKEKIILFLKTLTDYDLINNPKYSNPHKN